MALAQNTLVTTARDRYFNVVRRNLEAASDAVPADKYTFRLTAGQMTIAEWLMHSAQRNFSDCSTLRGEKQPRSDEELATLKTKDEVSKALKESFAYCAATIDKMDDKAAAASPQAAYAFLHTVVHNNEIYGNLVGYLRAMGITPPSTAARNAQKK